MARVMYFESNRSSADGMLAVGTVVMNRVESGKYPKTVCGVVGQKNQFAPGVLTKPADGKGRALADKVATQVLRGKRHRDVDDAMFFHTAGYHFSYNNMNYVVVAGGNAFYEKRTPGPGQRNTTQTEVAALVPRARPDVPYIIEPTIQVAAVAPRPAPPPRRPPPAIPLPEPEPVAPTFDEAPIALVPVEQPESIEDLIALSGG
jgi:hypothetical protein